MRRHLPFALLILLAARSGAAEGEAVTPPTDDRRSQLEDTVRRGLAKAERDHRTIEFRYRLGEEAQAATVTASDAAELSLRVDGAVLHVPWRDLPAHDLHALADTLLPEGAEKRLVLGRFAFAAGELDQAAADFARLAADGQRLPAEAGRMAERRLEVARQNRERNAAEAWERLTPLLSDERKRDEARTRLAIFERTYDDTAFIIGKRPQIAAWRQSEP